MAAGTVSNFQIYPDQFYGGMFESITQNVAVFNEASRGALRLVPLQHRGDYQQESFLKDILNLVGRRDNTSVAVKADTPMAQDEENRVKLNRGIGPVAQTLDAWRKIGASPQEMSMKLGMMTGDKVLQDYVNSVVTALVAAIGNQAALVHDGTAGDPTTPGLIDVLSKFGDKAGDIVAWVMHSNSSFKLMKDQSANHAFEVGGLIVIEGSMASLNRPVIITDSPSLVTSGSPDTHHILGLVEDAGVVMESEDREIVSDTVTGHDNLMLRIQGEYAMTVGLKGYKWDITNGGPNPTDAALGTGSNWDIVVADKLTAGAMGNFQ